ncbi:MAG TPA: nucleotide exchange factor GrpE [Myxococcota bacterium]|jgi:molecular chaperone GrpE
MTDRPERRPGKKNLPKLPPPEPVAEGWESLAEEASGGVLAPSPELAEALREAEEAVAGTRARAQAPAAESPEAVAATNRIEDLSGELVETKDRLIRLQADFENFRRRATREREEAIRYGAQNLFKDLLTTVDNLERAIDHARKGGGGDLENLLQGVELVQKGLLGLMTRHGVTEIEALGKPFDPSHHEAMAQAPDASVAPNTVLEVLQKGYMLRDRLLRPARVIVARPVEAAAEDSEDQATD